MGTNVTALVQKEKELPERESEVILEILTERARGETTLEALFNASLEMTIDQYWARKKKFPLQVQGLHERAHEAVRQERLDELVGFAGRQMIRTITLRESAAEALKDAIPEMARIVRGEDKVVIVKGQEKRITTYPRDVAKIAEILLKVAQGGVVLLEEHEMLLLPLASEAIAIEEAIPPLPPSSVGIHFTSVAIPPGSKVAIQAPDIIEGVVLPTNESNASGTIPGRESL